MIRISACQKEISDLAEKGTIKQSLESVDDSTESLLFAAYGLPLSEEVYLNSMIFAGWHC